MKFLAICLLALFGQTFGQSTVCDDAYDCDGATITTYYTYCYGFYACDEADISSTYLYGYGYLSNYYSDSTGYYTYAYGFYSFYVAEVYARYLWAYGYLTLYAADVEPRTSYLYAYLYGLHSGYYADILCYSSDYCYVYCGTSSGCLYTKFYCYSGATCYYHCDNADYCPTLYSGVGASVTSSTGDVEAITYTKLTDEQIKAKHTENKAIKKAKAASGEGVDLDEGLDGETEEATKARQQALLAVGQHAINGVNNKLMGNSLVYGGVALSAVSFIFGILFAKCIKTSDYEKI